MRESRAISSRGAIREMREKIANWEDPPEETTDYRFMSRVMSKSGTKVTGETVRKAMKEFRRLVPQKTSLDLNQFDIVMKAVGVPCSYDRQCLFKAIDYDMNNTVEYTEFVWGMAMLYDGGLALTLTLNLNLNLTMTLTMTLTLTLTMTLIVSMM